MIHDFKKKKNKQFMIPNSQTWPIGVINTRYYNLPKNPNSL